MSLSVELMAICRQTVFKINRNVAASIAAISLISAPAIAAENDTSSSVISFSANADIRIDEKIETAGEPSTNVDPKFQAIHSSWGGNAAPAMALSIPSIDPVTKVDISSHYGYRTDPFRGQRKNHKGLDIRGPVGTPIYATADAFVKRSQWVGGYGKFIELDHGNGITTRYGHMSALKVSANSHVKKGDVIGLMGSTGRSTGSHLHYEIRVAGEPVNPLSFMLRNTDPVQFAEKTESSQAQGGPDQ